VFYFIFQKIDVNDLKYFCVQEGKKRRLRVTNISSKDEGMYSCKVQNKSTSAKLYVARTYSFITVSVKKSVLLLNTLQLLLVHFKFSFIMFKIKLCSNLMPENRNTAFYTQFKEYTFVVLGHIFNLYKIPNDY